VGAGNVPVIIDRGVDLAEAAEKIATGAAFDNGIICSHEQFVLAPRERYHETIASFKNTGIVWFADDETVVEKLREVVFPHGHLNKDLVGRSAQEIGKRAGIDVSEWARIILVPARGPGRRICEGETLSRRRDPAL
jgi:succinate-semialdehyde dehydrogenase